MARWRAQALAEIQRLVRAGRVVLTDKARRELDQLAEHLVDEEDLPGILLGLRASNLVQRVFSKDAPEWLYVFKSEVLELTLYIKVAIRKNCVVISFHEDE